MSDSPHSVVALLGDDGALRSLVRATAWLEGWGVRDLPWRQPVLVVADWNRVDLVILIASRATEASALLAAVHPSGYEGPIVLLAPHLTLALRQRAFVQGALDVIGLPATSHALAVRLWTVLRRRPAPEAS